MKQILLILPIFLLAFTMAYFPGETVNVSNNLNSTNLVYTIIDNSTPINLDVNLTNEFVWFIIPYDIVPQEFTVIFVPRETEIVKETQTVVVHSGGGSRTRTITEKVNNTVYVNDTRYVPVEEDCPECINIEEPELELNEKDFPKSKYLLAGIILGLILIAALIWILIENKKEKKRHNDWLRNEFSNIDEKEDSKD